MKQRFQVQRGNCEECKLFQWTLRQNANNA